jgi:hypothetical protein
MERHPRRTCLVGQDDGELSKSAQEEREKNTSLLSTSPSLATSMESPPSLRLPPFVCSETPKSVLLLLLRPRMMVHWHQAQKQVASSASTLPRHIGLPLIFRPHDRRCASSVKPDD